MSHESDPAHPHAGETKPPPDLDLGDGHWLDWSTYKGERCGGIITHITDKNETGKCSAAFTIRGSQWNKDYSERASWIMSGTFEKPTLEPSFLCHCGDHGFVREGHWVRA